MIKNIYDEAKVLLEQKILQKLMYFIHPMASVRKKDILRYSPYNYLELYENSINEKIDEHLIDDHILLLDSDNNGRKFYIDCDTGLICFFSNNSIHTFVNYCTSSQYDIFDAAFFRKFICNKDFRKDVVKGRKQEFSDFICADYIGEDLKNLFSTPILEYTAKSKNELEKFVSEIKDILSTSKYFKKLWFRGQRHEYYSNSSKETFKKFGIMREFVKMPSLVPSLGRKISCSNYVDLIKNNEYWVEAFKIWTLCQSKEFHEMFDYNGKAYKEIVSCLEPNKLAKFIIDFPYDITEYVLLTDSYEELSEILSTQQYGGYSSMLDITDDLDVALFFTQSFLNMETRKYELCNPNSKNIIYLFVECNSTKTFDVASNIFSNATYDGIFELPSRINNQKCGLLMGANALGNNTYAYRIIAKIRLDGTDILTSKTVEEMFPNVNKDSLFKVYSDARPKLAGLYG